MNLDFIKNFEITPMNVLKLAGVLLAGLVVLSFAYNLFLKPVATTVMRGGLAVTQGIAPAAYDGGGYGYADEDYAYMEKSMMGYGTDSMMEEGMPMLSARNAATSIPSPEPPRPGGTGGDAEDYEVTEYNASIETRDTEETCKGVAKLKELDYVVFENASEHERGCYYTFKVEHEHVDEVLAAIEALDPRELSENTYTIKRQLDDYTSEEEILRSKLDSIDETLANALDAYDEITALATRSQDATALAKIFDSRINLIERLTQQRINVAAQLERLSRSKTEQLDRLDYTYFYVDVYENKFVDGKNIADSWKSAVKQAVRDVNRTVQEVTLGLVALIFLIAQWLLYAFILLIVVKYGWKVVKHVWNK